MIIEKHYSKRPEDEEYIIRAFQLVARMLLHRDEQKADNIGDTKDRPPETGDNPPAK